MLESAVLKQYLDLSCTVYIEGMSNGCFSYLILATSRCRERIFN